MKQLILTLLFSMSVFSQKTIETFYSQKLGEDREITIGLPASYEKDPTKQYPIIILLDGDYLFDPFWGNLNYGAYWDDLPETIVVGINQNKNQERIDDTEYDDLNKVPTNKGAQFFEFIGQDLLPYIEKKYRVAPFRIIAGNDITAGYLNFFLYKDNPVFSAYIAISPDLVPQMEIRIPERLSKLKQHIFYYQSTGDGDLKEILESASVLDSNIKSINNSSINYKYDHFKGASHYSTVLYSIPKALYQIFNTYKPISMEEYSNKISILQSGYVKYLTDKYDFISKNLGVKTLVRLSDFKAIEAAIIKNKAYEELDKLADVANKNYPKSMLADYELGLMYENLGDLKKAIKSYQVASQREEIAGLTKVMMIDKFENLQSQIMKK